MNEKIVIAVDAMGGENAPKKILDGIEISLKKNDQNFFFLYGDENILKDKVTKNSLLKNHCEIINTKDIILDDESPLKAVKRGKDSSM